MSTNILTVTSGEKLINIYFPLTAKHYCTVRNAKIVSAIVIGLFALFEAQWFFTSTVTGLKCIMINERLTRYYKTYLYMHSAFYSYIPLSLMFIFNTAIIFKLFVAKYQKSTDTGNVTLSKAAKGVTSMLVGTAILFILLTTPHAILFDPGMQADLSGLSRAIVVLLMYSNHAINIVAFSIGNHRFRREMLQLLCSWRGASVLPLETGSNSSAITPKTDT